MTSSISTSVQPMPQALQQLKALLALSAPTTALTYLQPHSSHRTPLIKEERTTQFRYWQNGRLHNGLNFMGELFYAVVTFDLHSYLDGIKVADDLRNSGILSVITASDCTLTIWVSMRSQACLNQPNACELPAEQNNESFVD